MYLLYLLKDHSPFWYASGTGERYAPDKLPLIIPGFIRFQWENVILFVPDWSTAEMVAVDSLTECDACFSVPRMRLML